MKSFDRLYLPSASILLLLLFTRLYTNLVPALNQAKQAYTTGQSLTLDKGIKSSAIRRLLTNGNYYTDSRDIDLVADSLPAKLARTGTLDNLGAINKRQFSVLAPVSWRSRIGGADFQSRLRLSRQQMGFDSVLYNRELNNPKTYPAVVQVGSGSVSFEGRVRRDDRPMSGVLVQLKRHPATAQPDTLPDRFVYARTDTDGQFTFAGLTSGAGYSVVPLKPGFEFGSRRGTAHLTSNQTVDFTARPHQLRLIGSTVYGQLKTDHAFTVRTPASFTWLFWGIVAGFFLAFWAVNGVWSLRRFHPDPFLLPILMLLTGLSVLILLAIQDPLQDTLFAGQTVQGIIFGLVGMTVLSQLNVGRFYATWRYDWLFTWQNRSSVRLSGWTWLVLAAGLATLTLIFGSGPEGSGVRVNLSLLGFSFQPSEITKYLLLLFFAGFFAANEQQLRQLPDLRWRFTVSFGALAGAGLLMLLYLLLGDMGPALVVCFTFLLFYSIARGNLPLTLATGIGYGVALWLLPGALATLLCLIAVIGYMFWKGDARSKTGTGWVALLAEAPVLLLLVLAMFAFGDQLPFVGDRLADRKAMWLNPWNNDVYGGDHLAHGYWALASGGWTGQGLGKGFANAIPAAHTDMILPSLGEELGGLGVVCVFLLFGILLHRLFLHARRAGQPFSFFLIAGIAIATGTQFLIIAGGSIGLLPLTGISVPFLSYGKISLIINLTAMGAAFSVAHRPGEVAQREYLSTHYDTVLMAGISGFLIGVVVLIGHLLPIVGWRGSAYVVRPARVVTRNGDPVYSYNPRIERLTRALAAGTIYDRNGLVLASSSPETVRQQSAKLQRSGLDADEVETLTKKRLQRYYPFGNQLFFWLGDLNTQLFWGQSNGYYAEATHLSELRGFNSRPRKTNLVTTDYRADRFSPSVQQTRTLSVYDYSELAPALRAGLDSREVAERKARNRDLRLSVNADLQVAIQRALVTSDFRNRRVSVVVLDAGSGDILASALHPLPNLQTPDVMQLADRDRQKLPYLVTERDLGMTYPTAPGSTAKILTAMAAFNKLGASAADVSYSISCDEIIRRGTRESEPCNESVDMRKAIVRSSNVYFIRTANDNKLDSEMADLYLATGMNIDFVGGYSFSDTRTNPERDLIRKHWRDSSFVIRRNLYNSTQYPKRYRSEFSGLAWGQGQLTSTPVALARMAGAIANKGVLQPSRYVLNQAGRPQPIGAGQRVSRQANYADQLESFMIDQSNPSEGRSKISIARVAGKTGTPERMVRGIRRNDGWFVFFAPTPDGQSHTVVSVRIELGESSAEAVQLANTVIAPILKQRGYLGSF
ncbi:FtsW/RodA/SpoVE family cell cycle protein [Spirosoma lituiforme]